MSAEAPMPTPALPSSGAMIATLGTVAMLSGFLVVLVFQLTQPAIEENRRLAVERAVFQVVPGAVQRRDFVVTGSGIEPAGKGVTGTPIYAAYGADGKLKGIAAEGAAQGYADIIRLLYGYDPACECITGIRILKMTETPGLGDKIAKEPEFLANFDALEAKLNAAGDALRNAIVTVKSGTKSAPWQIDAISGATISSVAVGKAINHSAQALLPRLAPSVNQIATLPATEGVKP